MRNIQEYTDIVKNYKKRIIKEGIYTDEEFDNYEILKNDKTIDLYAGEIALIGEAMDRQLMLESIIGEQGFVTHEEFTQYLLDHVSAFSYMTLFKEINAYADKTGVTIPLSYDDFLYDKDKFVNNISKIDLKVLGYILKYVNPLSTYENNCLSEKINFALNKENLCE